jgi:hypothetical protein
MKGLDVGKKLARTSSPAPIASDKIKRLAGKGLVAPSTLTTEEVQELSASVGKYACRKTTRK